MTPPARCLALALAFLLAVPALALPAAAAPADSLSSTPFPLFAKPRPLHRIAADPWLGSLWLGSGIGLIRLDAGAPPQQISLRQGLPGLNVYDIAVSPDRVWVATSGGAAAYGKGDGSVRPVLGPDGKPLVDDMRAIFFEPGAVWLGTNSKGLFRVDPATLRATPVENPVDHTPFTTPILGIGADGQEMFLSVTGYGLVDWHRGNGTATLHKIHLLNKERPLYGRLLVTPERVWVGTSGDGVVYLDRAQKMMGENASPKTVNSLNVGGLTQLGQETWMATDSGMSRRDGATDSWRNWQNLPWGNANDLTVLHGRVYAATVAGFVVIYERPLDRWVEIPWWTEQTVPRFNTVSSCDEVDGKLLFGTGGGGALLYDPDTHLWQKVGDAAGQPPDILIWDTAVDGPRTWIATQNGAALWDRVHNNWTYYRTDGRTPLKTSAADPIRQIVLTPDGAWFAVKSFLPPKMYQVGWQPGRLAHLETASGYLTTYQRADGLSNDNVTSVALSPGKVWVGMEASGLDVLDLASQHFSHIYPLDGTVDTVQDLLMQDGTLWMGTNRGLWKVDLDAFQATPVAGTQGVSVKSLAWVDGKLWVGTATYGIYSLDPTTGQRRDYRTPGPVDIWAFCMMPFRGQLFVGTNVGVERLDLATGEWLPQMGPNVLTGAAPARLAITAPAEGTVAQPGALLRVEGTAAGPADAVVEVRLAGQPWRNAEGVSSWQADLRLGNRTGDAVVQARIRSGFVTLMQTARVVAVPSLVHATHVPVVDAYQDQQADFRVHVEAGNLTGQVSGEVLLLLPNATAPVRLPLAADGAGLLTARSPPLTPFGTAHYHIELAWPGGGTTLPDPYAGNGADYALEIYYAGEVTAFAADTQCPSALAAGRPAAVSLVVHNTGARPANLSLQLSGPAAAWATLPPPTSIEAAAAWNVSLPLTLPEGTRKGTYGLAGTVQAGDAELAQFSCTLQVASARSGFLGIPGLGLPFLAAALLMALLRRRGPRA